MPCGRADKSIHTVRSPGKMPERNQEELLMKAKLTRLLSLLLTLVMAVGLLPMGQVAYAVDTLPTISNVVISDAGVLT